jgi:hypothetical protein
VLSVQGVSNFSEFSGRLTEGFFFLYTAFAKEESFPLSFLSLKYRLGAL